MKNWRGYQAVPVRSTAEKRNASKGGSPEYNPLGLWGAGIKSEAKG